MAAADPRLILRDEELDAGLELMMLAEAALWAGVDAGLASEPLGLGRSHWRAAFLLKRRPGVGVQELAGDLDGRRRAASLTQAGHAFEERIAERLRAQLAKAYRVGGLDGVAGARRILSALAGGRMKSGGG